jgi:hypothetical protein
MSDDAVAKKKKYMLTLKFDLEAIDDVAARENARSLLDAFCATVTEDTQRTAKLQEIFENAQPRKVEL